MHCIASIRPYRIAIDFFVSAYIWLDRWRCAFIFRNFALARSRCVCSSSATCHVHFGTVFEIAGERGQILGKHFFEMREKRNNTRERNKNNVQFIQFDVCVWEFALARSRARLHIFGAERDDEPIVDAASSEDEIKFSFISSLFFYLFAAWLLFFGVRAECASKHFGRLRVSVRSSPITRKGP